MKIIEMIKEYFLEHETMTKETFNYVMGLSELMQKHEKDIREQITAEIKEQHRKLLEEMQEKIAFFKRCPAGSASQLILNKLREDDTGFSIDELEKALHGQVKRGTLMTYLPALIKANKVEASNGRPKVYYSKGATAEAFLKNSHDKYSSME